jgi:hypothetical protein
LRRRSQIARLELSRLLLELDVLETSAARYVEGIVEFLDDVEERTIRREGGEWHAFDDNTNFIRASLPNVRWDLVVSSETGCRNSVSTIDDFDPRSTLYEDYLGKDSRMARIPLHISDRSWMYSWQTIEGYDPPLPAELTHVVRQCLQGVTGSTSMRVRGNDMCDHDI